MFVPVLVRFNGRAVLMAVAARFDGGDCPGYTEAQQQRGGEDHPIVAMDLQLWQ